MVWTLIWRPNTDGSTACNTGNRFSYTSRPYELPTYILGPVIAGVTTRLEEIVSALVPAVKSAQYFGIENVTSPFALQVGGVDYLAAQINITHDVEE